MGIPPAGDGHSTWKDLVLESSADPEVEGRDAHLQRTPSIGRPSGESGSGRKVDDHDRGASPLHRWVWEEEGFRGSPPLHLVCRLRRRDVCEGMEHRSFLSRHVANCGKK